MQPTQRSGPTYSISNPDGQRHLTYLLDLMEVLARPLPRERWIKRIRSVLTAARDAGADWRLVYEDALEGEPPAVPAPTLEEVAPE